MSASLWFPHFRHYSPKPQNPGTPPPTTDDAVAGTVRLATAVALGDLGRADRSEARGWRRTPVAKSRGREVWSLGMLCFSLACFL